MFLFLCNFYFVYFLMEKIKIKNNIVKRMTINMHNLKNYYTILKHFFLLCWWAIIVLLLIHNFSFWAVKTVCLSVQNFLWAIWTVKWLSIRIVLRPVRMVRLPVQNFSEPVQQLGYPFGIPITHSNPCWNPFQTAW